MPKTKVKIKKDLGLSGYRKDLAKKASAGWRTYIKEAIVNHITSGKSPVKFKKFKDYSEKYSKVKGREKPVDLKVTGEMLDSLKVTLKKDRIGTIVIEFKSKVAKYHDQTGRVIRRLLPNKNDKGFSPDITNGLIRILKKAVKKTRK